MRPRPPRTAIVALVGLAAVAVAVGANLILIDRTPAVDPLGRLSPSVVTVDVHSRTGADDLPQEPPPVTSTRAETVPDRTETEDGRTEIEPERTDTDERGGDDHGGGDHDDD